MYKAKILLWHSKDDRYVQPGEIVDFPHLTPEDIQLLINAGAIEPVAPDKKRKEVSDATTLNSN